MDSEIDKTVNILFIGGTGRSGTNLTKEILSKHPDVASLPFEYRFTLDPNGIVDCYNTIKNSWSPYIVHSKVKKLETLLLGMSKKKIYKSIFGIFLKFFNPSGKTLTPPPYYDWELEKWFPNYEAHVSKLSENLRDFTYNASWPGEKALSYNNKMVFSSSEKKVGNIFRFFLRSLIHDLLEQKNKTLFVEDNTWNILFAKELKEILPEAKFLHLIRDPRDVISSLLRQRWAPDKLEKAIEYYSSLIIKIDAVLNSLNTNSIKTIKLEDIFCQSRATFEEICSFCNLDYHKNLNDFNFKDPHIGRWQKEFNEQEKILLKEKTQEYCRKFGYQSYS